MLRSSADVTQQGCRPKTKLGIIEVAMNIQIEVVPLRDNQEISTSELALYHSGCARGRISLRREMSGDRFTLRCDCGLQLDLSEESVSLITYAAIDAQPRLLELPDSATVQVTIREIGS